MQCDNCSEGKCSQNPSDSSFEISVLIDLVFFPKFLFGSESNPSGWLGGQPGKLWYNVCLKRIRLTQPRLFSEECIFCQTVFNLLFCAVGCMFSFSETKSLMGEWQLSILSAVKYLGRRVDSTANFFWSNTFLWWHQEQVLAHFYEVLPKFHSIWPHSHYLQSSPAFLGVWKCEGAINTVAVCHNRSLTGWETLKLGAL